MKGGQIVGGGLKDIYKGEKWFTVRAWRFTRSRRTDNDYTIIR